MVTKTEGKASTLLPFCDAIFLEKQIAGFMNEKSLNATLNKMPQIYSLANKGEFLLYLDKIENEASSDHLNAVKEVYGTDWGKPFCKVLKDEFN